MLTEANRRRLRMLFMPVMLLGVGLCALLIVALSPMLVMIACIFCILLTAWFSLKLAISLIIDFFHGLLYWPKKDNRGNK